MKLWQVKYKTTVRQRRRPLEESLQKPTINIFSKVSGTGSLSGSPESQQIFRG